MSEMPVAALFASDGTPKGDVKLDPAFFGVEPNVPVMHQVVTAQLAAARSGTASTKTRSDVRGGGRKPWRQKGLGRARHGSIRSPQWVGGGVAFGPHPRSYRQAMPKKMRRLALRCVLSAKASEGELMVVDRFPLEQPKTKEMVHILNSLGADSLALIVTAEPQEGVIRSANNLAGVKTMPAALLNVVDLLSHGVLLMTVDAVRKAEQLWGQGLSRGETSASV